MKKLLKLELIELQRKNVSLQKGRYGHRLRFGKKGKCNDKFSYRKTQNTLKPETSSPRISNADKLANEFISIWNRHVLALALSALLRTHLIPDRQRVTRPIKKDFRPSSCYPSGFLILFLLKNNCVAAVRRRGEGVKGKGGELISIFRH
mmetsp:Transcript_39687/g.57969  ORF Transcript_39687/g.57969 Transcript_39687/m.57969 type:complete len:149 (+) Transcript_39687:375-821(+)